MSAPMPASLLAGFADGKALLAAAHALAADGRAPIEAYTPYPVEGLPPLLRLRRSRVPWAALAGGVLGGGGMFALQAYSLLHAYPLDVGGRPLPSWPLLLPAALEMALLGAVLAAFVALLRESRLPRLHHPLFALARFEAASHDGFFLCVPAAGPELRARLLALGAGSVEEVPG